MTEPCLDHAAASGGVRMDVQRLRRFDLNLVRVFLAVWRTGSLTLAGNELGLTQPAVSQALRRLREEFGDPLFVRVGHSMQPTAAAGELHQAFAGMMQLLQGVMVRTGEFQPQSSDRVFHIAMSDTGEFVVLPRLLALTGRLAPGVTLHTTRVAPDMIEAGLRSGRVDAAVGYYPGLEDSACIGHPVMTDRLICMVRAGHPALAAPLSPEALSRLALVDVGADATGLRMGRDRLTALGITCRIAARVEHFTILPEIIRRTDHAALFPQSVFGLLGPPADLASCRLDFDLPEYGISFWQHGIFAPDPGLAWLRQTVAQALQQP